LSNKWLRKAEGDCLIQNNDSDRQGLILVVDDTLTSLNLITEILKISGYSVLQAECGEQAIVLAQEFMPDLILLDIRMPGMDGYEVCRRLKADARTRDVPITFLSALDDKAALLEGFRLGAVDYIAKPYHLDEVLARVRTQVELRKLKLELEEMVLERTSQLENEMVARMQKTEELLESRQKLQELSGHMEEVREEERKFIARELHDEMGQILSVLRIDLVQLSSELEKPVPQNQEKLTEIIGMLDQVADSARTISENLRPGMLDVLGLAAAIQHHVEKMMESTSIHFELKMNQEEFNVDAGTATAVFRIFQESVTNIIRHAQAKNVEVKLVRLGHELILVVQDDGCGMVEKAVGQRRGFGILGMQERVNLLGGEFLIESSSARGTRIEVNFPIREVESVE
jgi:signal transduction histidine kinase